MILVQDLADKFAIDCEKQAKDTESEEVKLDFIDLDTVLEVINYEHEYGCKEIDGMYDGKRQVELRRCYDQPMNDYYDVSLENIPKIDVVFVVETHVVVSDDCKIENHGDNSADK